MAASLEDMIETLEISSFTDKLQGVLLNEEYNSLDKELSIRCLLCWLSEKDNCSEKGTDTNYEDKLVRILIYMLEKCVPRGSTSKRDGLKAKSYHEKAATLLGLCYHLLNRYCDLMVKKDLPLSAYVLRRISVCCVVKCSAHMGYHEWSDGISRHVASELLSLLYKSCQCSSIDQLLTGSEDKEMCSDGYSLDSSRKSLFPTGILGQIINYLKPFFTKDSLKSLLTEQYSLAWCIGQVKHPFLVEHFPNLMPALLLLVDDHKTENKILGITSLKHVIDNMNTAEVRWYGRGDVIYQALHHQLYNNHPSVVQVLHPSLLSILWAVEENPKKPKQGRKANRYDEVFQTILNSMEYESKLSLRRAYTLHIKDFIDVLGITTLRHLKRLLRVIFEYLEVSDGTKEEARINMLKALIAAIRNCWPRIQHHSSEIMKSLLKLIVNIDDAKDTICLTAQKELISLLTEGLNLLRKLCGEKLQTDLLNIKEKCGRELVQEIITASNITDITCTSTSNKIR